MRPGRVHLFGGSSRAGTKWAMCGLLANVLGMDDSGYPTSTEIDQVTCKACRAKYERIEACEAEERERQAHHPRHRGVTG